MRHASHALLPHTLAGRMPGVPLSPQGRAEAARLAPAFPRRIAALVTSPIKRTLETATILGTSLGLVPQPDPGLTEIDFGAWTGQRFDAIDSDPAWHAWNRLRALAPCPGGETMPQAQARALATLSRLRALHPDEAVILVSHADIIRALLAPALGLPLDRLYRLTIDPGSISTVTVYDDDWCVEAVNRLP